MGPGAALERLDTTTAIDTPERVRFRHRLAGPGQRGAAWLVDFVLQGILLVLLALGLMTAGVTGELFGGIGAGLFLLALFVLSWFYAAIFEWLWAGQTPGKRLLGLRVVRSDGSTVGLQDAVLRNLLRGVDSLPGLYVVGVLACLADERLRRLGDLVAGTFVVRELHGEEATGIEVVPPVSEAERQALPARVDLSREERAAIAALLRRAPRLSTAQVEELAEQLGPSVADRTGIEAGTWTRTLTLAWARHTGRDR